MKQLLMNAKYEIEALRRQNELLQAQVSVVNIFAAALGMKRVEGGMSPDVAWSLQKEIDRLNKEENHPTLKVRNDSSVATNK